MNVTIKLEVNNKEIRVEPNDAGGMDAYISMTAREAIKLLKDIVTELTVPFESAEDVTKQALRRMVDAQEYQKRKYKDPFLTAILAPYQDNEGGAEDETD